MFAFKSDLSGNVPLAVLLLMKGVILEITVSPLHIHTICKGGSVPVYTKE